MDRFTSPGDVWASQAEVQQKDIVLNFEFSMGDKLYVSRHTEGLVTGLEGLAGSQFESRGRFQIHDFGVTPLVLDLERKLFDIGCGVDSNTAECPYEGDVPGILEMSATRGQDVYSIRAVVGELIAVHVPSECVGVVTASAGVHVDRRVSALHRYTLRQDDDELALDFSRLSCGGLLRITIQDTSNNNHTERFRFEIPAGTSDEVFIAAIAGIYNTTADSVNITASEQSVLTGVGNAVRSVVVSVNSRWTTRQCCRIRLSWQREWSRCSAPGRARRKRKKSGCFLARMSFRFICSKQTRFLWIY